MLFVRLTPGKFANFLIVLDNHHILSLSDNHISAQAVKGANTSKLLLFLATPLILVSTVEDLIFLYP